MSVHVVNIAEVPFGERALVELLIAWDDLGEAGETIHVHRAERNDASRAPMVLVEWREHRAAIDPDQALVVCDEARVTCRAFYGLAEAEPVSEHHPAFDLLATLDLVERIARRGGARGLASTRLQ